MWASVKHRQRFAGVVATDFIKRTKTSGRLLLHHFIYQFHGFSPTRLPR
jgi:hypothetical protein